MFRPAIVDNACFLDYLHPPTALGFYPSSVDHGLVQVDLSAVFVVDDLHFEPEIGMVQRVVEQGIIASD